MVPWGWILCSLCDLLKDGNNHVTSATMKSPLSECIIIMSYALFAICRSNYRTPVQGLYLCGSGAHPGGGVMGASGRNAAGAVIQDWKEMA